MDKYEVKITDEALSDMEKIYECTNHESASKIMLILFTATGTIPFEDNCKLR